VLPEQSDTSPDGGKEATTDVTREQETDPCGELGKKVTHGCDGFAEAKPKIRYDC